MTAKEFLRQYENATKIVDRLRKEYERESELIDAIKSSSNIDGMPHGSGIPKPAEEKAIRLGGKFAAWKMAEIDALELRQTVFELIYDIPDVEGDILIERYVNLKKWEAVCLAVNLSWYAVHQHHKKALVIVQNRLNQSHT